VIAAHRSAFPLTLMCRVLQVSRAGFYAWRRRAPSPRRQQDTQLQVAIAASHRRSTATYGSPRILRDLHDAGHCVSRKRVARLMRAAGLRGIARRRFRVTTQSQHAQPVAPNLLARQFAAGQRPRVWAADLTYCWTAEGWLYLAVLLDLTSRRVVGWATSARLNRQLVLTALERALALRGPAALHHSDRGSQYASADYQAVLAGRGIVCSMSRRGNCYDNAVVESFFATLKRELLDRQRWPTRREVGWALSKYIDGWYNPHRRHSSLGYLSPAAFEQRQGFAA
jgi:putative transposase